MRNSLNYVIANNEVDNATGIPYKYTSRFPSCTAMYSYCKLRYLSQGIFCSPCIIALDTLGLSTPDRGSTSDADRGSRFKDHFASTRPWSGSELHAVLRDSAWDPVKQCNARSLRAVWSSRATTLNPDRGSGSSESVFSARVESPIVSLKGMKQTSFECWNKSSLL